MKGKALTLFPIRTDAEWAAWHAKKGAEGRKKAASEGG